MAAIDIAGVRFDKLVAVRPVGKTRLGVVWECRCDCGKTCTRTAAKLRAKGGVRSCPDCAKALHAARFDREAAARRVKFRKRWEKTGSLYQFGVEDLP